MKATQNILPASIEVRALELMKDGVDPIEAVKQALIYEMNFAAEMIEQRTERSKLARDYMFNRVCKKLRVKRSAKVVQSENYLLKHTGR